MPTTDAHVATKLSREDHEKWFRDLIAYGQAYAVETPDGRARYVSPAEASRDLKKP